MGAFGEGLKEGRQAGKKHGQRAGAKSDTEENKYKESAKSATKGAVGGMAEGATRGAIKGGAQGIKDGAQVGAKIGGSIPYVGVVTGPLGGVVGGAVGGTLGVGAGATGGALSGAEAGAEEGVKETAKKRMSARKGFSKLFDTIKGMTKGDMKSIFVFKAKMIKMAILGGLTVLVFFALIIEGDAENTSKVAAQSVNSAFENSTTDGANTFNTTGSLIFAKESELEKINTDFMDEIDTKNESYYNALMTEYSGKSSASVANRVIHITTNYDSGETAELDKVANNVTKVSGAVSPSDKRTIFQHILRAEKYNFNNIIWRSYVKSGSGVKAANMSFQVDSNTKLKYPASDSKDTDNASHDLNFFVNKTRSYLQSWYIPFDLMVGTTDAQSGENLNTKFAYEIMTTAYHEIVLDRYKIETLTRTTNYRVYDQTTTTTTKTRSCGKYEIKTTSVSKAKGEACTDAEYALGLCEGVKLTLTKKCTDTDYKNGTNGCKKSYEVRVGNRGNVATRTCTDDDYKTNKHKCKKEYTILCADDWQEGCTYGILSADITEDETTEKTLCTDVETTTTDVEKDVRESVSVSKDADNLKYRWDYVISKAKMFDNVISNDYEFEAFYNYSTTNYDNYINKKGSYKNMTSDSFKTSEESKSKADSYSHTIEDYYDKQESTPVSDTWNSSNVVVSIPSNATLKGNITSKVVNKEEIIIKDGEEYEDVYVWNDKLNFKETKSGIYNMESVTDVTGNDLSGSDINYYQDLYVGKEINIIDLMNSDKDIYTNYLSSEDISKTTDNIGIRKSALDISYNVLEKDLKEVLEKYPMNGLKYGSSLGLDTSSFATLSGLSFGDVQNIAAGNMEGMNVAYPLAAEDLDGAYLQVGTKVGNSYGYAGHSGVDISYAYAKADKSLCNDYSSSVCPYIKGPEIYNTMDGTIKEVGYSAYNKYYKEGQYLGNSSDGNLRISDTSGWGSYVKIENVDGTFTIYAHLFPDRDFFKKLSENIGQSISAGTFVGYMGNTGSSSGLHLHIEWAQAYANLGGGRTGNSSLTYIYLMKIINTMGISPTIA